MKYLLLIALTLFSVSLFSEEWISPIDKKYKEKDSELFSKLVDIRKILDSWSGENTKLQYADSLLREIIVIDKDHAPAYREYGRLFIMAGYINYDNFKQGSLSPAESSILKSLEIEPEYEDSYVLLGHLYTRMNRHKEARDALLKAEQIGTEISWLHLNWADLLKKEKNLKEALERYNYVINKGTENKKAYAAALSGITEIYRIIGENDKANEAFKREIEYSPEVAWYWGNYSEFLLFTYGDIDGAIEKGRKALQIMDYDMGRFILGCALYTKWAILQSTSDSAKQAQLYFDNAWDIYPYPEEVINKTINYKNTSIAAKSLQEWLKSRSIGS